MIWVANWVSEHIDQAGETSISQIIPRSCSRPGGCPLISYELCINYFNGYNQNLPEHVQYTHRQSWEKEIRAFGEKYTNRVCNGARGLLLVFKLGIIPVYRSATL